MNKSGLPEDIVRKMGEIFRDCPEIDRVLLYGSRAMGNWRNGSDIDLCVEAVNLTLSELWAIENRIDDLLLPWKVDLSLRHQIDNPDLLDHIDQVGQIFYQRDTD